MTEFWLFIIVGAIAVAAAVLMLLQDNAVYSALLLIVTMGCIAFLFLLLNAPFLAMVQITVYAGAIMVLFIFVIMLLGAEKVGVTRSRFGWLTPAAVILSTAFLLIAGLGVASGRIDTQSTVPSSPLVRVVNTASDAGVVDVFANDTLLASGLAFGQASEFVALPAGDYTITFNPLEGEQFGGAFTFAPDTAQSLVAYGTEGDITLSVVAADLTTPPNRAARVVFFNALPSAGTVDLVDLGDDAQLNGNAPGVLPDTIILDDLEPGAVSDPITVEEGETHWAFVAPNGEIVRRVIDGSFGRSYEVERETSQLVVLAGERSVIDDSISAMAPTFSEEARSAFGGPEAIGEDLFTRYLLPFELVSLLLLASMIGAIVLTHKEEVVVRDRAKGRRRVSRPLASVIASQVGHDVTTPDTNVPALPAEGSPAGD